MASGVLTPGSTSTSPMFWFFNNEPFAATSRSCIAEAFRADEVSMLGLDPALGQRLQHKLAGHRFKGLL